MSRATSSQAMSPAMSRATYFITLGVYEICQQSFPSQSMRAQKREHTGTMLLHENRNILSMIRHSHMHNPRKSSLIPICHSSITMVGLTYYIHIRHTPLPTTHPSTEPTSLWQSRSIQHNGSCCSQCNNRSKQYCPLNGASAAVLHTHGLFLCSLQSFQRLLAFKQLSVLLLHRCNLALQIRYFLSTHMYNMF